MNLPPRRSHWHAEGLEVASGRWGEPELVIARAHCRFGRFDLSRLPESKRSAALNLQVQGWSPFSQTDGVVAWTPKGEARVWCWDAAELQAAWQAGGRGMPMPRTVPETCLYPAVEDGVRLQACQQGFEAQCWRSGQLQSSRWWSSRPSAGELLSFQRDCGLPVEEQAAELPVVPAVLGRRPWAPLSRLGARSGQLAGSELLAYASLAVALAVPAAYLTVQQVRLSQARATAEAELAREAARSQGMASARNDALTSADQARALIELQPYPPPLVHMLAIARSMPEKSGATIKEWEQNEGKLRLLLVAPPGADIVGADHVRGLEQTGLFENVKILTQADPRQMAFTMEFKPQAALALPAGGASGAER